MTSEHLRLEPRSLDSELGSPLVHRLCIFMTTLMILVPPSLGTAWQRACPMPGMSLASVNMGLPPHASHPRN